MKKIKLNLGCGRDKKEGYINIDMVKLYEPDIIADVRKLPFEKESVDEIFAQDILEHLGMKDINKSLKSWYQVLKEGGKLTIQTPNIESISKNILNNQDFEYQRMLVLRIFGGWGNEENHHKSIFTPTMINKLLTDVGFEVINLYPVKDLKTADYDTNMVIECKKKLGGLK